MSGWTTVNKKFEEEIGGVHCEFEVRINANDYDKEILVFFEPFRAVLFCNNNDDVHNIVNALRSLGTACHLAGVKLGQSTNT